MNNIPTVRNLFTNKELFELALTHRSYVNENSDVDQNNERLEFLGDAILEYVVSSFLFKEFPDKEEGFLTAFRANIVNTVNLAALAKDLRLGEIIKLSRGEEQGNGRENESLLADTVEAIIGAIYIDQGLPAAEQFIDVNLLSDIDQKLKEPLKDPKSSLQETVQAKGLPAPRYHVASEKGPDHNKEFEVEVYVEDKKLSAGSGKSKSRAEQAAAAAALAHLAAE